MTGPPTKVPTKAPSQVPSQAPNLFEPFFIETAIGADASPAAIGADPYPHLPDQFAEASFDGSRSWDVGAMKKALADYGFLFLPGFILQKTTTLAFDEAANYFLGVMRSF